ncbi:MAG: Hsp33 family molecular chaperone HslO [Erysipelotrichaceae bacterium]|nr:Hsp33 family molecular chaperone HslO [Erysipelotrichaceae bacterium]
MKDKLVRAITSNQHVRILACTTTELVEQARKQHDLWPTSAAALGRMMSVTAILGSMLKSEKEKVTVQINGGGAIGTMMADANAKGEIRGFVGDPHQYLVYNDSDKLAVGLVVGNQGYLKVIKDMGLKDQFAGQVALQSGEIGDDFAYYFTVSEQTPSAVSVGVLVDTDYSIKSAGALIIQVMPDALEEDIVACEQAIAQLRPVSELVAEGMSAEDLVHACFKDAEILSEQQLSWHCDCSKDRFKAALTTLDRKDLEEMLEEDHGCEVKCQYCNTAYQFDEHDLNIILEFKAACGK